MPEYVLADFTTAGGTVATTVQSGTAVEQESPFAVWTRSESARPYEGSWVLLSGTLDPLDHDLSPTALKGRHPQLPNGGTIVFVPATTIRMGA